MTSPELGGHAGKRWVRVGLAAWVLGLATVAACGGSTTDGASTAKADAKAYCDRAEELGCDIIDDCPEFIADARAESAAKKCSREFDSALRCLSRQFASCQDDPEDLCPAELDLLERCDEKDDEPPSAGCSFGTGGSSNPDCRLVCDKYAADCNHDGMGNTTCTCTSGPQSGLSWPGDCDSLPEAASITCD